MFDMELNVNPCDNEWKQTTTVKLVGSWRKMCPDTGSSFYFPDMVYSVL
jgi:hypothetical protein